MIGTGSWFVSDHEPADPMCTHWGWRGGGSAPLDPPAAMALAGRRRAPPPAPPGGPPDGQSPHRADPPARRARRDRRLAGEGRGRRRAAVRPAAAGHGEDAHLDGGGGRRRARERTRQVARIGNNLNQLARWANANASAVAAVEVIAHLVAFERELRKHPPWTWSTGERAVPARAPCWSRRPCSRSTCRPSPSERRGWNFPPPATRIHPRAPPTSSALDHHPGQSVPRE